MLNQRRGVRLEQPVLPQYHNPYPRVVCAAPFFLQCFHLTGCMEYLITLCSLPQKAQLISNLGNAQM